MAPRRSGTRRASGRRSRSRSRGRRGRGGNRNRTNSETGTPNDQFNSLNRGRTGRGARRARGQRGPAFNSRPIRLFIPPRDSSISSSMSGADSNRQRRESSESGAGANNPGSNPSVGSSSDNICPICRTQITNLCITNCNHRFCRDCIRRWTSRNATCPSCRTNIHTIRNILPDGGTEIIQISRAELTAHKVTEMHSILMVLFTVMSHSLLPEVQTYLDLLNQIARELNVPTTSSRLQTAMAAADSAASSHATSNTSSLSSPPSTPGQASMSTDEDSNGPQTSVSSSSSGPPSLSLGSLLGTIGSSSVGENGGVRTRFGTSAPTATRRDLVPRTFKTGTTTSIGSRSSTPANTFSAIPTLTPSQHALRRQQVPSTGSSSSSSLNYVGAVASKTAASTPTPATSRLPASTTTAARTATPTTTATTTVVNSGPATTTTASQTSATTTTRSLSTPTSVVSSATSQPRASTPAPAMPNNRSRSTSPLDNVYRSALLSSNTGPQSSVSLSRSQGSDSLRMLEGQSRSVSRSLGNDSGYSSSLSANPRIRQTYQTPDSRSNSTSANQSGRRLSDMLTTALGPRASGQQRPTESTRPPTVEEARRTAEQREGDIRFLADSYNKVNQVYEVLMIMHMVVHRNQVAQEAPRENLDSDSD